jgi:hypothetical protein
MTLKVVEGSMMGKVWPHDACISWIGGGIV